MAVVNYDIEYTRGDSHQLQVTDVGEVDRMYLSNLSYAVTLKNRHAAHSIHHWSDRMREEINKIVDDIIVTLELGGNKADLDRMLSEI